MQASLKKWSALIVLAAVALAGYLTWQALGRNPFPLLVPCHRILAAGGRPGGFTAPGGVALKLRLLGCEGVRPRPRSPRGTPPPPSATSGRRTPIWPA